MHHESITTRDHACQAVLNCLPVYVCIKDREGRFLYANELFCALIGTTPERIVGMVDIDFFPKAMADQFRRDDRKVMETGDPLEQCEAVDAFRGAEHWVRVVKRPYVGMDGKVRGILCYFWDETEKKRAELALNLSEERFELFLQKSSDLIAFVSPEGVCRFASPSLLFCLGLDVEKVVGRPLCEQIVEEDRVLLETAISESAQLHEERSVEYRMRVSGDEIVYIDAVVQRLEQGGAGQLMIVGRDITRKKKNELMLRRSYEEAELLLSSLSAVLIGGDTSGCVTRWNITAEKVFGIAAGDAIGRPMDHLKVGIDWARVRQGVLNCLVTETSIDFKEVRYRRPDGSDGFLHLTINPTRGMGSGRLSYVILGIDTTQSVLMQYQLSQAQKLESIGQLAAGIAHEINTPSQFVSDNLRFLKDGFSDLGRVSDAYARLVTADEGGGAEAVMRIAEEADLEYLVEEIPKAIDQSLEGMDRIGKIVSAMRNFSHPDGSEKRTENINAAIETTITVCRNEWKYVADIDLDLDASLPHVPCFLGEFNQVVLNMVVNAAHAIADQPDVRGGTKGRIGISTRREDSQIVVRITDSGCGIPQMNLAKVFDPFFTTKEVGKGTGQGLYIAHSVITEKHGGEISVASEMGKGTTFTLKLPIPEANPEPHV